MATIILRQSGSISSPESTVKGSPLTNLEVDNNFSNLNISVGVLSDLDTEVKSNIVFAVNELKSNIFNLSQNSISNGDSNITISASSGAAIISANIVPIVGNVYSVGNSTHSFSLVATNNLTANVATATEFNATSDATLKDNMQLINDPFDVLSQIRGMSFNWKTTGAKSYGVSAQEVESVLPEIVRTDDNGTKSVNYLNLIAFLIESVKELSSKVTTLENKLK